MIGIDGRVSFLCSKTKILFYIGTYLSWMYGLLVHLCFACLLCLHAAALKRGGPRL